tara:strand:+ start:5751 stop:7367 length:1617 start_codon:yes stop_codon:yes gene_type:complete
MSQTKTIKLQIDAEEAIKRLDKVEKELAGISKASKETAKGTKTLATGFKGIGLAWKAIGIGAVISALQFLADKFSANQEIMDKVNIASAVFGDVMNKIGTVVMSVVKGLGLLGKAVGKVLKGKFKEAGDLATQSFDGVKDAVIGNNESFSDFIKNAKEGAKATVAYAKTLVSLQKEVQLAEANQRLLQMQYQKEAEIQRQVRDDISLTFEERIAANEKLGQILDEQFAEEKALAQKKIDLAALELSRNKDNVDLQVALINAKTEMADLDERITGQRSEQLTNLKGLEKEQADAVQATIDAENKRLADIEAANLKELELAKKLALKELELAKKLAAEQKAIDDKAAEEKEQQIESVKAMRLGAAMDIFNSLHSMRKTELNEEKSNLEKQLENGLITQEQYDKKLKKIEENAEKRQKKQALVQILVSTAQGISKAIAAGAGIPFPANLGAIIAGVAAVVGGMASAKAALSDAGGDGGGDVSVDSGGGAEQVGGIGGLIPNLENISPTENGDMQPVQAYVVENDISDAQALQEELEIQATL